MPIKKKKKTKVKKKVAKKVTKKTKVKKKAISKVIKESSKELIIKTKPQWIKSSLATKSKYQDKYSKSIKNNDEFWRKEGKRITWIKPYKKIKDVKYSTKDVKIKWFHDGTLNASANCIDRHLKDKKDNFILAVMLEDRRLDMKALFKSGGLNIGRLSFASAERMIDMLGITPGSVTPFSLINVDHQELIVVLDKAMLAFDYLNYHPLHNEATTTIHKDDLIKFIEHLGFKPTLIDFDQL